MLDSYLVDTCEKIELVRDEYGDYLDNDNSTTYPCRFRFINTLERGSHSDQRGSDALIHLPSTAIISMGNIIKYNQDYYQVERIYKAQKLGSTRVEFIKVEVKLINIGIS